MAWDWDEHPWDDPELQTFIDEPVPSVEEAGQTLMVAAMHHTPVEWQEFAKLRPGPESAERMHRALGDDNITKLMTLVDEADANIDAIGQTGLDPHELAHIVDMALRIGAALREERVRLGQ